MAIDEAFQHVYFIIAQKESKNILLPTRAFVHKK